MSDNNPLEIERKFTLKDDRWQAWSYKSITMDQGYFTGETCPVKFNGTSLQLGHIAIVTKERDRELFESITNINGSLNPELATVRIRQENNKYFLTIKKHIDDVSCFEPDDYELNEAYGKHFLEQTDVRLQKTRYYVGIGNNKTAHVDVYAGENSEMENTAEVEFSSIEEATAFKALDWFEQELTKRKGFSCQALARKPYNQRNKDERI